MGVDPGGSGRRRRWLAPSEKYELYLQVLTGQATQREAAERWRVDRSTVVHICRVAKQGALDASVPGRPGQSGEQAAMASRDMKPRSLVAGGWVFPPDFLTNSDTPQAGPPAHPQPDRPQRTGQTRHHA